MSLEPTPYTCRVGGLAVAMGIAAAIATGHGVARADDQPPNADKDSAQVSDAAGASHAKGPLSTLAARMRKTVEDGANNLRKRVASSSAGFDAPIRPAAGSARQAARRATGPNFDPTRLAAAPIAGLRAPGPGPVNVTDAVEKLAQRADAALPMPDSTPIRVHTPVTVEAAPVPQAAAALPKLVTTVLAEAVVAPLTGTNPLLPADPPALLVLLGGWSRRELERRFTTSGQVTSVASAVPAAGLVVDPNQQTPKPAAPVVGATSGLGWVTGPGITNLPSGTPGGYGIAGTDLGIMWDDGEGHVLTLFGDTFDQPGMTGVWRSNVLLRSVDHDLANGLQFQDAVISPGGNYDLNEWNGNFGATQVIRDPGLLGLFGSTTTIIPTAAISVTDENGHTTQYANVMSVRTWDTPGRWTTNWSAIAYSDDGGLTWTVDPNTVRSSGWLRASTGYVPGNQNFQQGAFVKGPDDDVDPRGVQYVYSFGTPSGRGGSAYVSRVPEDQIRDLGAYEYWAGDEQGWVRDDPSAAVPVIGATNQSPPPSGFIGRITKAINDFLGGIVVGGLTGGNVGELSVQYNPYLDEYVALSTDANNNVVMRVSDSPQGVWSDPTILVANNGTTNTGMYAPMIHPWSGTDELGAENEDILYWNLSYWGSYDVALMQTDLSPMGPETTSGTTLV